MNKSLAFFGRQALLENLLVLYAQRKHVLVVGIEGIGKTALLRQVSHRCPMLVCEETSSLRRICDSLERPLGWNHYKLNVVERKNRLLVYLERRGEPVAFDQVALTPPRVARFIGRLADHIPVWIACRSDRSREIGRVWEHPRKIALLRNALIATLETRLRADGQFIAGEELKNEEVLSAFREVEKSFDKIVLRSWELGQGISGQAPLIIKATVERLVVSWRKRSCEESSEILTATIIEVLAKPIAQMEEEYYSIRNQAWSALHKAEKSFPHGLSLELPAAAGMPQLDRVSFAQKLQAKRPPMTALLVLPFVKWRLHRWFQREIVSDLGDFLDLYTKRLRNWFRESIDALKRVFESAADVYRVQVQKVGIHRTQDSRQMSLDLDRLKG